MRSTPIHNGKKEQTWLVKHSNKQGLFFAPESHGFISQHEIDVHGTSSKVLKFLLIFESRSYAEEAGKQHSRRERQRGKNPKCRDWKATIGSGFFATADANAEANAYWYLRNVRAGAKPNAGSIFAPISNANGTWTASCKLVPSSGKARAKRI